MYLDDIQREQKTLQFIREHHLEKLYERNNPSGILICQKHANGFRWQKRDIKNGCLVACYLSKKEKDLAEKLAVNLYRIICIQCIQKQLHALDILIRDQFAGQQECSEDDNPSPYKSFHALLGKVRSCPLRPADFFSVDSPYRQLIIPFLQKEYSEIIDWYIGDFPQYNEYPEHLQYDVKLGFKVRSKSEVIIADNLYKAGILFHYEEQLFLSEDASNPDFFVPITALEKYAWEHFGAMDKENYFHRTRGRILNYLDHHWYPWINLITTYETKKHPFSEELAANHINWLKHRYRMTFLDLPPDGSFNMYDLAAYAKYSRIEQS